MNFTKKHSLMAMKKGFSLTAIAAAVALTTGCSPDDPDAGTNLPSSAVTGVVADAYLAGATVYLDANDNGKRDAWEAAALTDKNGMFSKGLDDQGNEIDYCAAEQDSLQRRHCLETTATGDATLRAYGGFDIFTGEPFLGEMAAGVSLSGGAVPNQVVSPLTSIIANSELSDDETSNLLTLLGMQEGDQNKDFLGTVSNAFDADLTNTAITLHKIVQLFANEFDDHFDAFGDKAGFPQSSSSLIYKALAEEVATGRSQDAAMFSDVLESVNKEIQSLYRAADSSFPGNASDSGLVDDALAIMDVIDNAIPSNTASLDAARTGMVGVELVVAKMNDDASDLQEVIDQISGTDPEFYQGLQNALDIDFSALLSTDFGSVTDFSSMAIGAGGDTFGALDRKYLLANYDEDDGISGKALFLFNGDDTGSAGTLELCIAYNDGGDDGEIYNTEGTLLDVATWFAIDDRRLVMNIAGAYDLTLISRGEVAGENLYSMGYGGKTASWTSASGLGDFGTFTSDIPTDDASCQSLLGTL
jgi:methyl-accepting chemotaxis protein